MLAVDLPKIHLPLDEPESRIPEMLGYATLQWLHESHEHPPRQDLQLMRRQRLQVSGEPWEPPLMSRQAKHPRDRV